MYVANMPQTTFSDRISTADASVSLVEARVIDWLARNRETALHASAAEIAAAAKTSDATVIRTARKLGYGGLDALRRALAEDLRRDLTLADRMANELERSEGSSALAAATAAIRGSIDAIEALAAEMVQDVVTSMIAARRIHVFGIGPSGFVAGYFAAQLVRLGFDARAISRTGLQFADDLVGIGSDDLIVALAYERAYPEIRALFDHAQARRLCSVLVTSSGARIPDRRATITLRIPRGRSEGFGLHAGTMALLEGLLLALSAAAPERVKAALENLNAVRQSLSGGAMAM